MHTSPWLKAMAAAAASAAATRSGASAKTMLGLLPPASSQTRFMFDSPAWTKSCLAMRVDPVKTRVSTSGCSASAWPTVWP